MRRVYINGSPPQDWIDEADAVTRRLRAAGTDAERSAIIEEQAALWRDDRIRTWLLRQFANKCWYTEAFDSVSSYHVDHYRPKGRVRNLDNTECEGYWWLAFDWTNYRICGQLINVKKLDAFPLVEGLRASVVSGASLHLECPVLIDPVKDEARLISYRREEDACIAVPAAGVSDGEMSRASLSIFILGLNRRDRLNSKRAEFWDRCRMEIAEYEGADGPQALRSVLQAAVLRRLRNMVAYSAEFSSVAEACIRTHAPGSLVASIFEHRP